MSRCKAYFCNGFVDYDIDEQGELCPKCIGSIVTDLNQKIAQKIQNKLDKLIQDNLKIDDLECDDD